MNRFTFMNIKTPNDYLLSIINNQTKYSGNLIGNMSYEQYLYCINIGFISADSVFCFNTGNVYDNVKQI